MTKDLEQRKALLLHEIGRLEKEIEELEKVKKTKAEIREMLALIHETRKNYVLTLAEFGKAIKELIKGQAKAREKLEQLDFADYPSATMYGNDVKRWQAVANSFRVETVILKENRFALRLLQKKQEEYELALAKLEASLVDR